MRNLKDRLDRLEREAGPGLEDQVRLAHLVAFGRAPGAEETAEALAHARADGLASLAWVLLNSSEFFHVE